MYCINKNSEDYKKLVGKFKEEFIADGCIFKYNIENRTEGEFPDETFIRQYSDFYFGTDTYFDGEASEAEADTEQNIDKIQEAAERHQKLEDELLGTAGDFLQEISHSKFKSTSVKDLTYSSMRERAEELASQMAFTRGKGESKYIPTGMTASMGKATDPFKGPIKKSEETMHTHAGEWAHKTIEDTLNHFKDADVTDWTDIRPFVLSCMEGSSSEFPLMQLGGVDRRKTMADRLSKILAPILKQYHIIKTEIPVSFKNPFGTEQRGAIDLMLQDKDTNDVGIVEIKTSAESDFVDNSKFNQMSEIGVPGSTFFDKTQIQSLAYKEVFNQKYEEKYLESGPVQFRALLPISIDIDRETGEVRSLKGAEIRKAEELTGREGGRLYALNDTVKYQQDVSKLYGLGNKYRLQTQNLELRMMELKNQLKNMAIEAGKLHHKDIKDTILNQLTGFNIDSDLPSILEASHKYIAYCSENLLFEQQSPAFFSKIYSNIDTLGRIREHIGGTMLSENVEAYIADVLHLDPLSKQGIELHSTITNAMTQFQQEVEALHTAVVEAQEKYLLRTKGADFQKFYLRSVVLPEIVAKEHTKIKAELMEAADKGGAKERHLVNTYRRADYEDAAMSRAMQVYEENKDTYDNESAGFVQALFGVCRGNEQSQGFIDVIFKMASKLNIAPIASKKGVFIKDISRTIFEGRRMEIAMDERDKKRIVELHKGVVNATKANIFTKPKEMYDFMLKWNKKTMKDGSETNVATIIDRYDWDKVKAEREKLNNELIGLEKEERDAKIAKWFSEHYKLNAKNETEAGEKLRKNMEQRVQELFDIGVISEEDLNTFKETDFGGDVLWKELDPYYADKRNATYKTDVANYMRRIYKEEKEKLHVPNDSYLDDKYQQLMAMDKDDPRRVFYDYYKKTIERYDLLVPEVKRLGNNLPARYASTREHTKFQAKFASEHKDYLAESYAKNSGPGLFSLFDLGSEEHNKAWFQSKEERERQLNSFAWSSRIPLPYSGYQLDPEQISYNMAESLFSIASSLNHYQTFLPKVAEMEFICEFYERTYTSYNSMRGTNVRGMAPDIGSIRKMLDRMVYSDKGGMKALDTLTKVLNTGSIITLGLSLPIAVGSHYASLASIFTQYAGRQESSVCERAYAMLMGVPPRGSGQPLSLPFSKEGVLSCIHYVIGNLKQKQLVDFLGFNEDKKLYDTHGMAHGHHLLSNIAYLGFSLSDSIHRGRTAENLCRTLHVYDKDGKDLGTVYDNLTPNESEFFEKGNKWKNKLHMNPEAAFFDKHRTKPYSDVALARMAAEIISVTTSPVTSLDRPEMGLDVLSRMASMIKTIAFNTWTESLRAHGYDYITGEMREGAIHSLFSKGGLLGAIGEMSFLRDILTFLDRCTSFLNFNVIGKGGKKMSQFMQRDLMPHQMSAIHRLTILFGVTMMCAWAKNQILPSKGQAQWDVKKSAERSIALDPYIDNPFKNPKEWAKLRGWLLINSVQNAVNPFAIFSTLNDVTQMGIMANLFAAQKKVPSDALDILLYSFMRGEDKNKRWAKLNLKVDPADPIWGVTSYPFIAEMLSKNDYEHPIQAKIRKTWEEASQYKLYRDFVKATGVFSTLTKLEHPESQIRNVENMY